MAKPEDTLIIETTKGRVTVEMRPDLAPDACRPHQGARAQGLL